MKFAILLKSSLLFNSFYCLFINKTLRLNNVKIRTAINAKNSVFVICVEAIIYLLLYNLRDCTFKFLQEFVFCFCCINLLQALLYFIIRCIIWLNESMLWKRKNINIEKREFKEHSVSRLLVHDFVYIILYFIYPYLILLCDACKSWVAVHQCWMMNSL